jgi:hypothetical protein
MARPRPLFALCLALGTIAPVACAILIIDDGDDIPPPDPTWVTCAVNSECSLITDDCCGACGEPGLDDVVAVNRRYESDYRQRLCPHPVACAACPTESAPNLLASCVGGHCFEIDVRAHRASACERDEDCRLRTTGCCECGGSTAPYDLIAISAADEAPYRELVCDPRQACPECAPVYPAEAEAYCTGDGHCALRIAATASTP